MLKLKLQLFCGFLNVSTCSLERLKIKSKPTIDKQPTIFLPSCVPPFNSYDEAIQHICLNGEKVNTAFSLEFSINYQIPISGPFDTISQYYDLADVTITFIKFRKKTCEGELYNISVHKPQYISLKHGYERMYGFVLQTTQYLSNRDQHDLKQGCQHISLGNYLPFTTMVTIGMVKRAVKNFQNFLGLKKGDHRNYAFILHIELSSTDLDKYDEAQNILCTNMFQVILGMNECSANLECVDPNEYHLGDEVYRDISLEDCYLRDQIVA